MRRDHEVIIKVIHVAFDSQHVEIFGMKCTLVWLVLLNSTFAARSEMLHVLLKVCRCA